MLVISIVPRLPPAIDGVGDYALNLANQLRQDFGIETHFVVGDPTWTGETQIEEFLITRVSVCSANSLLSLLPSDRPASVLLHYVGYGYAKRGCPSWIVDGLKLWRTGSTHRLLVTMFHELYASGAPWTSAFWLSSLQRNLAARLAQLSDHCLTSKQHYAETLYELSQGKQTQISTLPVFCNIGEPDKVPRLAQRSRRLVVFGSRGNRLRVYQKSLAELSHACQLLGIKEVLDVGPSIGVTLPLVNSVPIVEMGQQSATEISAILLNSSAGFLDYNPDYLAKSGIFAAYCAHGLLPVSSQASALPIDGIEPGKHYWIPDDQTTALKDLLEVQAIADNAYNWYQTHNLTVQANTFATHLTGNVEIQLGKIAYHQSNY